MGAKMRKAGKQRAVGKRAVRTARRGLAAVLTAALVLTAWCGENLQAELAIFQVLQCAFLIFHVFQ